MCASRSSAGERQAALRWDEIRAWRGRGQPSGVVHFGPQAVLSPKTTRAIQSRKQMGLVDPETAVLRLKYFKVYRPKSRFVRRSRSLAFSCSSVNAVLTRAF